MNLTNLSTSEKKSAFNNLMYDEVPEREQKINYSLMLCTIFKPNYLTVADGLVCYKVTSGGQSIIIEYDWYKNIVYISSEFESKTHKFRPIYRKDNEKLVDLASWVTLNNAGLGGLNGWQTIIV